MSITPSGGRHFIFRQPAAIGQSQLVDDLAVIDWTGKHVVVVDDVRPRRDPDVDYALVAFARTMHNHGAIPIGINLPIEHRDDAGLPIAMTAGDFIEAGHANTLFEKIQD